MFKTRLLSGVLLVIVALITLICGGDVLFATLLLISLIGMSELYKIYDIRYSILGIVGYVAALAYYVLLRTNNMESFLALAIACIILLMVVYVFSFPKFKVEQVTISFFGLFYVAIMLSFIYQIRVLDKGNFIVWLVFICSWGCDTCAYCVGMLFGKHKMAPKLSPKKSIEGGIGGVLGAALIGIVYAIIINKIQGVGHVNVLSYGLIGGIGGMISQVGDLAASAIKRNKEIKDYGTLIPGHGGILDRFDSVIFTAPVIYYLAIYIMS